MREQGGSGGAVEPMQASKRIRRPGKEYERTVTYCDCEVCCDLSLGVITCYTCGNMTGSAARFGGSPGPVLFLHREARVRQIEVKPFLPYAQQVDLLIERGMAIADRQQAERQLATLNYYRLSGYWHSMRQIDPETRKSLNTFRPGSSFELTVELYRFDERLRQVVFADLSSIELAMRALIGYRLGAIDPLIHLDSGKLGAPARQRRGKTASTHHEIWLAKYENAVKNSQEEFVKHHREQYGGQLPIWVAVEIMDWGTLSHLYRMAPSRARNEVATTCHLRAPQLESWLKCLNILRNYAAHHARVFNKTFDIKPKLPKDLYPRFAQSTNRVFGQLTLIRHLQRALNISHNDAILDVLESFPHNTLVPFTRLGAPENWRNDPLWRG